MKTVRFQPTLAALSGSIDPFEIKNSIVLIEDDTEYLIGDDAYKLGDSGARIVGGTVKDRHYQRLIKALLAKGLGAGEHEISVGFSASSNYMDEFRDSSSKNILSEEDFHILSDKVSEIKFRVSRTDAPVQVCRIKLTKKKVPVLYETEAVRNVIPEDAKTYAIFQVGGGDWQSTLVVDGEICLGTHTRVGGMNNCITTLAEDLDIAPKTAAKAWLTGKKPATDIDAGWECCKRDKSRVSRGFINAHLPTLLNSFEGYTDRIKAIVVSGGAVHDEEFVNALRDEVPSKYKVYTIDQFETMEPGGEKLMDPSFACAFGIQASGVDVGLDIGNAYLKGVFSV